MPIYDITGNEITFESKFDSAVSIKPIDVGGDVIVPFNGDGTYYPNPYSSSTTNVNLYLYDENKQPLAIYDTSDNVVNRMDLAGQLIIQQRHTIKITGKNIEIITYINYESAEAGVDRGVAKYHTNVIPTYMKYENRLTYSILSDQSIEEGLYQVEYNNEKYLGFFEQIKDYVDNELITSLNESDEHGRKLKSQMIYTQNKMRHALRLATFNIATVLRDHWVVLKECLENYGIDICGLQEVRYPLTVTPTLVDFFTGWAFPYVSDNGDAYRKGDEREGLNERNLLSRIPIDSTEEYELTMGTDYRYLAKSVLSLPRYMDKRGSENLKMSVYNFQLEVSGTVAQTNAREVLDIVTQDDNPFIILMGDTNDFSTSKEVWKMFQQAGFKPVVSTNTATVSGTYDYNCIDNFFLSDRISALNYDVINAQKYPFIDGTGFHSAISDHDLVIADVVFDYSDIRCVNYQLSHITATATNNRTWLSDTETLTITLTPESGYTLGTITVRDCMLDNPEAITISGNTITLDGSELIGDVLITCSGVAT